MFVACDEPVTRPTGKFFVRLGHFPTKWPPGWASNPLENGLRGGAGRGRACGEPGAARPWADRLDRPTEKKLKEIMTAIENGGYTRMLQARRANI